LGRSALCRRRRLCRTYQQATRLLTFRLPPCRRAGLPTTPTQRVWRRFAQLAGRQHAGPRGCSHDNYESVTAYSERAAGGSRYQSAALHLTRHTGGRRASYCERAGDDRRCGGRSADSGHRYRRSESPAPVLETPVVASAVLVDRTAQKFFIDFDA